MEKHTTIYYLNLLRELLEIYKNDEHSLSRHIGEIGDINPSVYNIFHKLYKINDAKNGPLFIPTGRTEDTFAKRMNELLPKRNILYTDLDIKPLNKYNGDIKFNLSSYTDNYNYLLFLLMFTEEYALDNFTEIINKVSRSGNIICGSSNNIILTMEKNKELDLTTSEIIIPNEAKINYNASSYRLEKSYKKPL